MPDKLANQSTKEKPASPPAKEQPQPKPQPTPKPETPKHGETYKSQ